MPRGGALGYPLPVELASVEGFSGLVESQAEGGRERGARHRSAKLRAKMA